MTAKDGLKRVIDRLDKLYLKDTTLEKYQALEASDSYQCQPNTPIYEHIHQFEKLYFKLKGHGTTMSKELIAYKLLKSAKLLTQDH